MPKTSKTRTSGDNAQGLEHKWCSSEFRSGSHETQTIFVWSAA
jgi:hypothetical protein